jgi:hypothetical protein
MGDDLDDEVRRVAGVQHVVRVGNRRGKWASITLPRHIVKAFCPAM